MNPARPAVQAALEALRALPFVDELDLRPAGAAREAAIRTGRKWHVFRLVLMANKLDDVQLARIRTMAAPPAGRPLLIAAHRLRPDDQETLRKLGIAHVDGAGNCFLPLGQARVVWIEGRRVAAGTGQARVGRGLGAPGYRVELALLAQPELLTRPIRVIAADAGVGKTAVAEILQRLRDKGLTVEINGRWRLVDRARLIDDWLAGYDRILRPRLLLGEFEAADAGDVTKLQERIANELGDGGWAFGGGIAAHRWTGHWRGELTIVHVAHAPDDLPQRLRLLPARKGRIALMRVPCRGAIDTAEHLAHPLLVYAELMCEGHDRAREAALEVRRRFPDAFE